MTKEELENQYDVRLEPAPITGGADIQMTDFVDSISSEFEAPINLDYSIYFSHNENLYGVEVSDYMLHIGVLKAYRPSIIDLKTIAKEFAESEDLDDLRGTLEDGSVNAFQMESGNIYVWEYREFIGNTCNYGSIFLAHTADEDMVGKELESIQEALERGNEDAIANGNAVCTTEVVEGFCITFYFWYPQKRYCHNDREKLIAYLKENCNITEGEKAHALEIMEQRFPLPDFAKDKITDCMNDFALDYDFGYDDIFSQEDTEELFYNIID